MKYGMVILGGAAGEPLAEYQDRTPIEAAATPALHRLAQAGRVGAVAATPADLQPDPGVCRMALLGVAPQREYPGRGAIDALGLGLEAEQGAWAVRLDLLCAGDPGTDAEGLLLDAPRGVTFEEESRLIRSALDHAREVAPDLLERVQVERLPAPDRGALLIDRSGRDYEDVETASPDALIGEPWEDWLPASGRRGAPAAESLVRLMELASEALNAHPLNAARRAAGLPAVNMAWAWGASRLDGAAITPFADRYRLHATMFAESIVSAGLAKALGMNCETWRWREAAETAADMLYERLLRTDLLCIVPEIGSTLEQGAAERIAAIEAADSNIIRPLAEALGRFGDAEQDDGAEGWRLLVVADRFLTSSGADPTPTPLLMAGAWVRSVVPRQFNEREAISSDLAVEPAHELMEYFLRGGMAAPPPRPSRA